MKTRIHRLLVPAFFATVLGVAANGAESNSPKPATMENVIPESELATLRLTPKAEQRLGIALAETSRKKVAVTRLFGADVVVPLGEQGAPTTSYFPLAASTHDELLRLTDQQAFADGEVARARVQLEFAQRALQRARKLIQGDAGSIRAMEDADALARIAEQALEVAVSRRALLGVPVAESLRSPRLWIRVPVYVGEIRLLDTSKEARVGAIGTRPGDGDYPGHPVRTPPSANPLAASVDLFYEVRNTGDALRPGQRVSVSVPTREEEDRLVVPWAAILHDIHGNTWVYENPAPQTFRRSRVQVSRLVGGDAVLASGPKPGTKVVTDGAAELFGTEFGGGK